MSRYDIRTARSQINKKKKIEIISILLKSDTSMLCLPFFILCVALMSSVCVASFEAKTHEVHRFIQPNFFYDLSHTITYHLCIRHNNNNNNRTFISP